VRSIASPWLPSNDSTHTHRYDTARQIKEQQDAYCTRALAGEWEDLGEFPDNLQWEALVDVLRGRVKVPFSLPCCVKGYSNISPRNKIHTHCYEAVDLDDFVRVRNAEVVVVVLWVLMRFKK
jgi:hypothetical protein